jgi:hypothetical protein
MKKLLVGILVALAVLVIVAMVAVSLLLDGAVKRGIETLGPKLTQVSIKLDGVSLSLLSGSGKVKGLIVGNPEGYTTPQAIRVGLAGVSVSPGSVLSDKIVVRSVRVEAPEITYEGGLMRNNLNKILDNVKAATGGGVKPVTKDSTPAEKQAGRKLQVDDFLITGAKVHVSGTLTIPLPDIHLTDLGKGPDGITAADLTRRVLDEVVTGTLKAVANSATEIGKGAANTATDAAGKATKGISDLFKKKP